MVKEIKNKHPDKELERAVGKALKRIEKMIHEEPNQIVIEGDGNTSSSTISEVTEWLLHRRQKQ